jgi:L-xylulokinase
MNYYLGLDNGGTSTKAALYDALGRELAVSSRDTRVLTPAPDRFERDMEEMWQANCAVIREVLEKSGVRPAEVAGVALCGHGKGLYLWGKDGRPVRGGILSTDNRAYAYVDAWRRDGTEEKVFALSCQHIMACQPVALLPWLRDHEPEALARARWAFGCKDYVRFRLTGEARGELTDCSGAGAVNLRTRRYDPQLLALFGIPELMDLFPPLCRSDEIAGYVTQEAAAVCGLAAGTPVLGGMFDIDACAVAANVLDEENVCMIAGTWSINEYLRPEPVTDGRAYMNSLFCLPEYCLIEESSSTSAGNLEWFIRTLLPEVKARAESGGGSVYALLDRWVSQTGPETFVPLFLPFLMGSNAHPNARGVFAGLSADMGRELLARSVYEGVVYCHRVHLERLLATKKTPPDCVRLAGGAARSEVWSQMFADILGLPVERLEARETGTLGCAILAAAGTGAYSGLREAARAMSPVGKRFTPNPRAAEHYDRRYALYKKLVSCLDPLWGDVQRAVEG